MLSEASSAGSQDHLDSVVGGESAACGFLAVAVRGCQVDVLPSGLSICRLVLNLTGRLGEREADAGGCLTPGGVGRRLEAGL
jgi:hypothetical protein